MKFVSEKVSISLREKSSALIFFCSIKITGIFKRINSTEYFILIMQLVNWFPYSPAVVLLWDHIGLRFSKRIGLTFLPVSPKLIHHNETYRFIQRVKIDIHRDNAESHWNREIFPLKLSNGNRGVNNTDNDMPGFSWLQNKVIENHTPTP